MAYPLAIFTPLIGATSETFIRRHVEELLPGRTVAIAETMEGSNSASWRTDLPLFVVAHAQKQTQSGGLPRQALRALGRRVGLHPPDVRQLAREFLQANGVQVLMGEYLDSSLQWLDVTQSLGIPFFGHAHGFDVSARLRDEHWRQRYLEYRNAAGIVTMSEVSRQRLIELGLAGDRIHVIPYGVDVLPTPPDRIETESLQCLAVGRMVAKKAPILTLDAFRRAADRNPRLHLDYIGGGQLLPAAQQFVRAFGLEERVTLHGVQSHEFVREKLRSADVFLQHSITDAGTGDEEGLPVGILEAMANGLPVIATRHAGIPEAVADGETGLLVDEGDSRKMAEQLSLLAEDGALRRRMGRAGWERASSRFSCERERRELIALLGLG